MQSRYRGDSRMSSFCEGSAPENFSDLYENVQHRTFNTSEGWPSQPNWRLVESCESDMIHTIPMESQDTMFLETHHGYQPLGYSDDIPDMSSTGYSSGLAPRSMLRELSNQSGLSMASSNSPQPVGYLTPSENSGVQIAGSRAEFFDDEQAAATAVDEADNGDTGLRCEWRNCRSTVCFRREGDLIRHIRKIHVNPRSYVCNYCSRSFNRKDNLMAHNRQVHFRSPGS